MGYNQLKQLRKSSKLDSFKKYCAEKGIKLLRDDIIFINNKLNEFSRDEYKLILRGYLDEWLLGVAEAEKDAINAQSLGRRRANLWLLGLRRI